MRMTGHEKGLRKNLKFLAWTVVSFANITNM